MIVISTPRTASTAFVKSFKGLVPLHEIFNDKGNDASVKNLLNYLTDPSPYVIKIQPLHMYRYPQFDWKEILENDKVVLIFPRNDIFDQFVSYCLPRYLDDHSVHSKLNPHEWKKYWNVEESPEETRWYYANTTIKSFECEKYADDFIEHLMAYTWFMRTHFSQVDMTMTFDRVKDDLRIYNTKIWNNLDHKLIIFDDPDLLRKMFNEKFNTSICELPREA